MNIVPFALTNVGAIILVSAFFGISRLIAPSHDVSPWGSWEAFAHLWCGFLIGVGMLGSADVRKPAWGCLGAISSIELVMFMAFKLLK